MLSARLIKKLGGIEKSSMYERSGEPCAVNAARTVRREAHACTSEVWRRLPYWTIIAVLVVLWLLGLIGGIGGSMIHALLVIAAIVLIYNLVSGRRILN
jgi:hypothetical protein